MSFLQDCSNVPAQHRFNNTLAGRNNFFGLMDDFFKEWPKSTALSERTFPALNIKENETSYVVEAELPGVQKSDVSIDFHDSLLTIKGEKKATTEEKKDQYHRIERSYGSFSRSIQFPTDADAEKIVAKMEHGILKIEIAKATEDMKKKRSIAIS